MRGITTRINVRRATTVGLTSFATLTLIPLLAHAKPSERAFLLLAAVPTAVLFGYLAGYAAATTAGTGSHLDAGQLHAAQQDIQARAAQLRAAQRSASATAHPSAPVIRVVSEPIPQPGPGSPVASGHLAALARPPANQPTSQPASQPGDGLRLVPAPSRGAFTTMGPATEAAPSGLTGRDPHLTLIVTQPPTS